MRKKIDRGLEVVLSLLMGFMVLNVLWQVASRYLLNSPSTFTDELSRYVLIWVGLLGAAFASGKNLHVAIELLEKKLSEANQKLLKSSIQVLVIVFAVFVLIVGGTRLVFITFQLGQTSSALQLPLGYVYAVVPISGLLICYYAIMNLLNPTTK